jgi:hypothetical protein
MGGVTLFMVLSSHLDIVQCGISGRGSLQILQNPQARTHNQRRNRLDQVPQIQRLATLFSAVRFNSHVLQR